MLVSFSHHFIFVHTPKTAGTSVQRALSPFSHPMNSGRVNKLASDLGLVKNPYKVFIRKHATALQIKQKLGAEWQDKLRFGFVRNPWDLMFSYYNFISQNPAHHRHQQVLKMGGFEQYIDYEISRDKAHQHTLLCDQSGQLLVDVVGRFEHLAEDFTQICSRIGVDAQLPHANASKHTDYRSAYTTTIVDKVAKHWAKDISLFNYHFE